MLNNFTYYRRFLSVILSALYLVLPGCTSSSDREKGKGCADTMVFIPAGEFIMGTDGPAANRDEKPAHPIVVSAFYIDCCEVTNAEYREFVRATGHEPPRVEAQWAEAYNWTGNEYPPGTGRHPVVLVSWHDASAYAAWAGKRLPSEAEWEKASRAGMRGKPFPYGDTIEPDQANFFLSYLRSRELRPAGSFKPNAFGIHDMAGNVWEWCRDWYAAGYYRSSTAADPSGPAHGDYKVFRGGSWKSDKKFLRCAQRGKNSPDHKSPTVGFRCVRPANQSESREGSGS